MNQDTSYDDPLRAVENDLQKLKKLSAEQGETVVGLASSVLSLFAPVVISGIVSVSPSVQMSLDPGLAFIVCGTPACSGVLVSFWALILRPGWIPVLGILVGLVGILTGLWFAFVLGFSQHTY